LSICFARGVDSDLRGPLEPPISITLMVHHIVLYKLNSDVTPPRVEAMMMNARMQLLKIPEVLSIKCGKRIDAEMDWPFFIAIDFESMDKYAIFREDPIYMKFVEEVIKPNTEDSLVLDFEMDPGKDVRFS
jgi:Stress responsive A/B Barrel Domain